MVDININLKVSGHEKLRDCVASGIGATAGPLLASVAPWRALQEGKAKIIAAKVDAEVQKIQAATDVEVRQIQAAVANGTSQLIAKEQAEARKYVPDVLEPDGSVQIGSDDVQNAMEFQTRKRLMNTRAIAGYAAEELKDKEVSDHNPDPDWIARFFDGAQDVSSEELQKLWGRILAGEVKSPGQTSLRTLSILRNMTQKEAQDFSDLMRFRINNFILDQVLLKIWDKHALALMVHFSDIGLTGGFGPHLNLTLGDDGTWTVEHCGHLLRIEGQPGQQLNDVLTSYNSSLMTAAGLELAKLCQYERPNYEYLSHFAKLLAEQDCKLLIRKIVSQDDQRIQFPAHTIEPFVEPEKSDQQEPNNAE